MSLITKEKSDWWFEQESSHREQQHEELPADDDCEIAWSGLSVDYEPFVHRSQLEEQILLAAGQTC